MARVIRSNPTTTDQDFWSRLASFVSGGSVVVDRPKGSPHPRMPGLIYPLDYGYLTTLRSGDGDGVELPTRESRGLRAGESLNLEFYPSYAADDLRREPIFISFSDGRAGVACR